jgi:hypothetical protein
MRRSLNVISEYKASSSPQTDTEGREREKARVIEDMGSSGSGMRRKWELLVRHEDKWLPNATDSIKVGERG